MSRVAFNSNFPVLAQITSVLNLDQWEERVSLFLLTYKAIFCITFVRSASELKIARVLRASVECWTSHAPLWILRNGGSLSLSLTETSISQHKNQLHRSKKERLLFILIQIWSRLIKVKYWKYRFKTKEIWVTVPKSNSNASSLEPPKKSSSGCQSEWWPLA